MVSKCPFAGFHFFPNQMSSLGLQGPSQNFLMLNL
jgi:hypothetical protein